MRLTTWASSIRDEKLFRIISEKNSRAVHIERCLLLKSKLLLNFECSIGTLEKGFTKNLENMHPWFLLILHLYLLSFSLLESTNTLKKAPPSLSAFHSNALVFPFHTIIIVHVGATVLHIAHYCVLGGKGGTQAEAFHYVSKFI